MNRLLYNYIANEFFSSVTLFGMPTFYIVAILIIAQIDVLFSARLAAVLIMVEVICVAIKCMYRKERPLPQQKVNWWEKIDAGSFPSVHTARITALTTMVNVWYNNAVIICLSIALVLVVGFSRVYLKKHYPIDVMAGLAVGLITGVIGLIVL